MSQPVLDPGSVAALHLDATVLQRVFHALLEALASPGAVTPLPSVPGVPPALLPLVALARPRSAVSVVGDHDDWEAAIAAVTGATPERAERASLVSVVRPATPQDVTRLAATPPQAPEQGVKLILAVAALARPSAPHPDGARPRVRRLRVDAPADVPDAGTVRARLQGLGIPAHTELCVRGLDPQVLAALGRRSDAGNGVDTFLVAERHVVGLPRTARCELLAVRSTS